MSNNKEFSIFQVFDKLSNLNNGARTDGDAVKRFGVCWKIQLYKYSDGDVFPLLICENSEAGDWSINTTCDVTVGGKPFKTGVQFEFKQSKAILDPSYISRSLFSHYQIDGTAVIEYRVTINRMTGIEIPKVRKFDDDVAKESSDVVLMVENQQFHVNKMYLSLHSTYFKSLFSGNFEESGKSEIELKDIDSSVFHDFLEVLYREPSIDENNCFGILKLADMYDAKTAVRRCEDYLIKISQKSLHEKFEAATQYKLEELTEKCIFGMKTRIEICSVMPKDPNDTVSEILKLADFFDAKVVVRRCEEFLMNTSKESLKFKFPLAIKNKLAELKKKCFSEMTKSTNFKDLIPDDSTDFDTEVWKEFFSKAISFI